MRITLLLCCFITASFSALSQEQLTENVSSANDDGSVPNGLVEWNNLLVFKAYTSTSGQELWKTDGTPGGTVEIKDIYPGSMSSTSSEKPLIFKNSLYFVATDGVYGYQLWKSNATQAGTVMVTDFLDSYISDLTVVGENLFFLVQGAQYNWEVWKSDGTASGTVPVKKNISAWNAPTGKTSSGGLFYFTLQPYGSTNANVWRSDGTESGTFVILSNINGNGAGENGASSLSQFITFNNQLYFIARSYSLFGFASVGIMKTDGTVAGTVAWKGLYSVSNTTDYADVIEWKGKLYFSFYEAASNHFFIWETDGTSEGTKSVYDVHGASYFAPSNMSYTADDLLFTAPNANGGTSLIKYNPISLQTQEIKEIKGSVTRPSYFRKEYHTNIITKGSENSFLINTGEDFSYNSGKVWISDGTPTGTLLVEGAVPFSYHAHFTTYFKSNYYFPVVNDTIGIELWQSDGTISGTALFKNIADSKRGALEYSTLFALNNGLLMNAVDSLSGDELWKSDGTKMGTALLKDITPGKTGSNPLYYNYGREKIQLGNNTFFSAYTPDNGTELWKTDGTALGTVLLKDITAGTASSTPRLFTSTGTTVFFITYSTAQHSVLWKTDGTAEGTVPLKDFGVNDYQVPLFVNDMIPVGETVFLAITGAGGDLWKSNGTEAGTVMVKHLAGISTSTITRNLYAINATVYLSATATYDQPEILWKSDGTETGTVVVKNAMGSPLSLPKSFANVNGKLFFTAKNSENGRELWSSDGTEAGTILFKDILSGPRSGLIDNMVFIRKGNLYYFAANDGIHGMELWQTDGTSVGTKLVKDIVPGTEGSSPVNLALANDQLYFSAYTPEYGMELWKSNGTEPGTMLAADVLPGSSNSNPAQITRFGTDIFFIANTAQLGRQLWKLSTAVTGTEKLAEVTIHVYPNPGNGEIHVSFGDRFSEPVTITILNQVGRNIYQETIENPRMQQTYQFNIRNQSAGLYFINMTTHQGTVTKKIIKY